jgi:hypothetical protein
VAFEVRGRALSHQREEICESLATHLIDFSTNKERDFLGFRELR